jgi:Holliday junction resolvase
MTHSFEDYDDFELEELTKKRKTKVNGKKKGNRVELELSKILTKRFGKSFTRSIGSGNRWSQVKNLSDNATQVFSGDLVCPTEFKFVLESKGGYDNIDMTSLFCRGNSELDGFLEQALKDSKRCGRKPMLCWKKTRKPWLAFVLTPELQEYTFKYKMQYGIWTCVALKHLLELHDEFFLI